MANPSLNSTVDQVNIDAIQTLEDLKLVLKCTPVFVSKNDENYAAAQHLMISAQVPQGA